MGGGVTREMGNILVPSVTEIRGYACGVID